MDNLILEEQRHNELLGALAAVQRELNAFRNDDTNADAELIKNIKKSNELFDTFVKKLNEVSSQKPEVVVQTDQQPVINELSKMAAELKLSFDALRSYIELVHAKKENWEFVFIRNTVGVIQSVKAKQV